MKRVRYALEAAGLRLGLTFAHLVPRRVLLGAGAVLGRLWFHFDRRHRAVTLENLGHAFPDRSPAERCRLGRRSWQQLGRNVIDVLSLPRLGPDAIGRTVHYRGLEHIRQAYAEGRGVLLFSGHFGHWEVTALMQGYLDLPLTLVTRRLDNPALEATLSRVRTLSGNTVTDKHDAAREMIGTLREGRGVAIVIDQDARERGVFVSFLGRAASTTPTLARLALRTGASIVPTFCLPQPDGSYRITYEPPVTVRPGADPELETLRVTEACTAVLERWVRMHPEHWLWMHRRWKTRPATAGAADPGLLRAVDGGRRG